MNNVSNGKVIIQSAGINSVHLVNTSNLDVEVKDPEVRIVLSGTTQLKSITADATITNLHIAAQSGTSIAKLEVVNDVKVTDESNNYVNEEEIKAIVGESAKAKPVTIEEFLNVPVLYFTGTEFVKSETPVNDGNANHSLTSEGFEINVTNNGYIDSGIVISAGTLTTLASFEVQGTGFGVNLYIDLDGDNKFFNHNAETAEFIDTAGDAYGPVSSTIKDGKFVVNNTTSVEFYAGPDKGKVLTLDELAVKYPNAKIGFWIGVTSADGAELTGTIKKVTLRNK